MKKRILIFIALSILVAFGIYYKTYKDLERQRIADNAWIVFQDYLERARRNDVEGLKALSYQLSTTCTDTPESQACKDLMYTAYSYGLLFRQQDITKVLYDDKQIIMATEFVEKIGQSSAVARGVLCFIREGESIKFLSLNPFQGTFILDTTGMATSTISEKLQGSIEDTDGDTLANKTEECADMNSSSDCAKTDPMKMDTDGDGFWDSIEILFYKK